MGMTEPDGGKLVRDRIPEIIRADGAVPVIRTAGDAEIDGLLLAKLVEEVEEYADSREVEELADVVEVCFAAAARQGVSVEELLALARDKRDQRGGFAQGLVWSGNRAPGPDPTGGDRSRRIRGAGAAQRSGRVPVEWPRA
ncbi:nucleoside triphosphate pyrophosphohydrolase [Georgenia sp. TF02-10]|uniref:nucleoside triphosphate pyrophosphohydrolase n=1 Tax=Georgenia sp. TF02-10 TaxID=2917725 RepID=UPI001FA739B4|nr:nucleoside triphosphate pyrophosphohydrolase [Georgenia sp. TF02-10]UNX54236.1 nucleoside triphosphate pyrophosphohydrolase [Georgenia sp. TF02-10]